ncbi:MAG: hypothetical protein ACOYNC_15955, partial [Bacteroidales bacterium]
TLVNTTYPEAMLAPSRGGPGKGHLDSKVHQILSTGTISLKQLKNNRKGTKNTKIFFVTFVYLIVPLWLKKLFGDFNFLSRAQPAIVF